MCEAIQQRRGHPFDRLRTGLGSPNQPAYSPKLRLVVMTTLVRS